MIIDHKRIDLYGKMLFEKVILTPPLRKPNPMPNEACFLHVQEGLFRSSSETDTTEIVTEESLLMKCGNYVGRMYAAPSGSQYKAVAVHFYPEVLLRVFDGKLPGFLVNDDRTLVQGEQVKVNSDQLISQYIQSVLFYFDNRHFVTDDILALKLKEILLLLSQTGQSSQVKAILANLFNPSTSSFREIIEAHIYSNNSVPELAELTYMSLSSFKREFKRVFSSSPSKYIIDKKLEKACEMLSITDRRVSEIGLECGFNNLSHFSKAFKSRLGMTPTGYRKGAD